MRQISSDGKSGSVIRKIVTFALMTIAIVLTLMFSLMFLAVLTILGVLALAYVSWKTHGLRKQIKKRSRDGALFRDEVIHGEVIEGEAVRVVDPQDVRKDRASI